MKLPAKYVVTEFPARIKKAIIFTGKWPGKEPPAPPKPPAKPPAPAPKPKPVAKPPAPPKPPADPLAAYRKWKPKKTEAKAVAFLKEHHGVETVVTRLEDYPREWPRPGTADGDNDKPFADEAARLAHLNKITAEWNRLKIKYPGLPTGSVKVLINMDGQRGRANLGGGSKALLTKGQEWPAETWSKIGQWEDNNRRYFTSERQGTQVEDNFRHELAHTMTTQALMDAFQAAAATQAETATLEAVKTSISDYAGADGKWVEALAEAFGIYTRERYLSGRLPANLEAFLQLFLGA